MKYKSVFEIIGPIMVGPSSSHTAGAVRIGQIVRTIFGCEPTAADIHFYGSFAQTYKGHATDVAIVAGLLAFNTNDERIQDAISIAGARGIKIEFFRETTVMDHPNTVRLKLYHGDDTLEATGISIGGGAIEIIELYGFPLKLSGEHPALLIFHRDAYGTVSAVTGILAEHQINISHMEVSRKEKGQNALMVIETDQKLDTDLVNEITSRENIHKAIVLNT